MYEIVDAVDRTGRAITAEFLKISSASPPNPSSDKSYLDKREYVIQLAEAIVVSAAFEANASGAAALRHSLFAS
jgi:hypothetical protein